MDTAMLLNDQQIAQFVVQGGFIGEDRAIGVAVVLAESRGVTDARGDAGLQTSIWGPSIGLFQIRSLKAEVGTGGVRDELANLDPATNARHAHRIFLDAGSRWTPWSTFNHGSHLQFMNRARRALNGAGPAVHTAPDGTVHIVRSGDTLSGIARTHGLTLAQLRALNPGLFDAAHHGGDRINVGERVVLARSAPAPAPVASAQPGHAHVVRSGDTLSAIAQAHGVTLDRIRALNPGLFDNAHHNGNLIPVGEVVRF
jgi:LysM repeat protein